LVDHAAATTSGRTTPTPRAYQAIFGHGQTSSGAIYIGTIMRRCHRTAIKERYGPHTAPGKRPWERRTDQAANKNTGGPRYDPHRPVPRGSHRTTIPQLDPGRKMDPAFRAERSASIEPLPAPIHDHRNRHHRSATKKRG